MLCSMRNSKSALICLTKFREPTEIIMKNISRSLIITQARWTASSKSSRVVLLGSSKDSQLRSKKEFKLYLKKRLKMLRKNQRQKHLKSGRRKRKLKKQGMKLMQRRQQQIQKLRKLHHQKEREAKQMISPTLMFPNLRFQPLLSTHLRWAKSLFSRDRWIKQ